MKARGGKRESFSPAEKVAKNIADIDVAVTVAVVSCFVLAS